MNNGVRSLNSKRQRCNFDNVRYRNETEALVALTGLEVSVSDISQPLSKRLPMGVALDHKQSRAGSNNSAGTGVVVLLYTPRRLNSLVGSIVLQDMFRVRGEKALECLADGLGMASLLVPRKWVFLVFRVLLAWTRRNR